jgi:pyrroloquinoline quinone biosynthesis protein D
MTEMLDDAAVVELAPTFRFQWEEAQDCYVILYPEGMVKLSASAGEIMKRCDGSATVSGIIADLTAQFPGVELDDDVRRFIDEAGRQGWIRAKA